MPILTPDERIGTVIAEKFELLSVLGRGGMGVVYEAIHRWTGRRVAVKLIDPALADDPELAARFLNEARAAARLRHPNVIDVLDMGRADDGTVYQVLALLEGETLGARLAREGKLAWTETRALLAPVMDALEAAHEHGIVHRDVKPDNVFLRQCEGGAVQPVLLDFGMAKLLDARAVTTRSSAVFGTPHYMAPEQALGASHVGPAADVWSVGVMLYECLSGTLPFGQAPAAAYVARVLYEDAPSIGASCPELPPALAEAVDRALARDLSQRHRSMRELLDALRAADAQGGVRLASRSMRSTEPPRSPRPAKTLARRTRRASASVLALVLAALALIGGQRLASSASGVRASPRSPTELDTRSRAETAERALKTLPVTSPTAMAPDAAREPALPAARDLAANARASARSPAASVTMRARRKRPKPSLREPMDDAAMPEPVSDADEETLPTGMTEEW